MNREKDKKILLKIVKQYGYAPGGYLNRCGGCNNRYTGDKRAIICFECACRRIIS